MNKIPPLSILAASMMFPTISMAENSLENEDILDNNPVYIEFYTRYEEERNVGLQGLTGWITFTDFYDIQFGAEVNTDGYYEYNLGKFVPLTEKAWVHTYVGYTQWNYRLSLRAGYNFDNGLMINARVRPEFGYDDWIGEDENGNEVNYGTNLSVRTDLFVGYNSDRYEFFYNRVDNFETDEEIADTFRNGTHMATDHEFRVTYTANKWRPYFQATIMKDGFFDGISYEDDLRWQVGFALPMNI
ncbi:oligogalacturonate-specific porin KdgM family protein [Vibrio sp. 1CM2L]|uniref:oligogalacturonate-specific porin KdgM family protein n=1 Tax=Vibrio TaxID=662 RepID=UPI00076AB40B|nr:MULTISPECIES: oligogalacturonate-specific porin KdgM family protein [Vibrio]MCK8075645.1 oligogalacturonate-specific porin KdgM family protein [Vibrio sp. 1CM2L]